MPSNYEQILVQDTIVRIMSLSTKASIYVQQHSVYPLSSRQTIKLYRYDGDSATGTPTIFDVSDGITISGNQYSFTDDTVTGGGKYTYQYVICNLAGIPQKPFIPDTYDVSAPQTSIISDTNGDGIVTKTELNSTTHPSGKLRYIDW